jgi:hypothetical protein
VRENGNFLNLYRRRLFAFLHFRFAAITMLASEENPRGRAMKKNYEKEQRDREQVWAAILWIAAILLVASQLSR